MRKLRVRGVKYMPSITYPNKKQSWALRPDLIPQPRFFLVPPTVPPRRKIGFMAGVLWAGMLCNPPIYPVK